MDRARWHIGMSSTLYGADPGTNSGKGNECWRRDDKENNLSLELCLLVSFEVWLYDCGDKIADDKWFIQAYCPCTKNHGSVNDDHEVMR